MLLNENEPFHVVYPGRAAHWVNRRMMGNYKDEITHGSRRSTRISRCPIAFSFPLGQLGPGSFPMYAYILLGGPLLVEKKGSNGRKVLLNSQGPASRLPKEVAV